MCWFFASMASVQNYHDLLKLHQQKSTWDCSLFINVKNDNQWMIHDLGQSLQQKHKLAFPVLFNGLDSIPNLVVAVLEQMLTVSARNDNGGNCEVKETVTRSCFWIGRNGR
jgi:hypothetical protein